MVKIKDSFQVEIEMEQKMSPQSKKMSEDYYECRVQFRLYMFSKEDVLRKLSEREQEYLLEENKYSQMIFSNKQIKYEEIKISDYDIAYFKLKYILRKCTLLINKLDETPEGFDIYLANINEIHKLKRIINNNFFASYNHSKKIMGRNKLESRDLFRHSLLIAIYNLNIGDIIQIKGEVYSIKSIQKNEIIVIHTTTRHKETFNFEIIKDYLYKK
ncbi:MAG: NMD3-related protein [Candidatus Nanoarchaeia archaeon]